MNLKGRKFPYYFEKDITALEKEVVNSGVQEVLKVARKYQSKPLKNLTVLDAGSGRGEYALGMSKHFKEVVGIEPFKDAYSFATKNIPDKTKNLSFFHSSLENFSSKTKFDLIVMLTVFEHLQNPEKAFDKALALLKKDGFIYLTAPNKYWLFEQHYGLPFLAWLPLPLANIYLKIFRGVPSYEDSSYSRGYQGMKDFFNKYQVEYEFVLPLNSDGSFVGCGQNSSIYSSVKSLGINLIRMNSIFWNISKGFIVVIKKK